MFPVCTGINRPKNGMAIIDPDVPCMHRDKPGANQYDAGMF